MQPVKLAKSDVARALTTYQMRQGSLPEVFARLGSVQFDPLSPAGCNHDLVLQARVPGYKIGDWQKYAYADRIIYDGWDKMASLVSIEGWPLRRVLWRWFGGHFETVRQDYGHALQAVLQELEKRGPLAPKEFEFQERREDWKGSWYGPNVTKRVLRALWHSGKVMTHSRRGGHHVYDLTERIVPESYRKQPELSNDESMDGLLLDRHRAMGLIRPVAPFEVWSIQPNFGNRKASIQRLIDRGQLVKVEVDGIAAHATPKFLEALDEPAWNGSAVIGPLDQILWDRKMIAHLFGFEYFWEVYKPEAQRRWGYYVLPVLVDGRFVARFDVWARSGVLEIRSWHWEPGEPLNAGTWDSIRDASARFMSYCSAKTISFGDGVPKEVKKGLKGLKPQ